MRKSSLSPFLLLTAILFGLQTSFTFAQGEVIYHDDFKTLNPKWKFIRGNWEVEDGRLIQWAPERDVKPPSWNYALLDMPNLKDVEVSVEVFPKPPEPRDPIDTHIGIVCRFKDDKDYTAYLLPLKTSSIFTIQAKPRKYLLGKDLLWDEPRKFGLSRQPTTPCYATTSDEFSFLHHGKMRWFRMRVRMRGDLINCYLDEELVLAARHKDARTRGRVGLMTYAWAAKFRNFTVRTLPADIKLLEHAPEAPLLWEGKVSPSLVKFDSLLRSAARAYTGLPEGITIPEKMIRKPDGSSYPLYVYHHTMEQLETDRNGRIHAVCWPVRHHVNIAEAFLNYYNYSGDRDYLDRAIEVMEWSLTFTTTPDSPYPNVPIGFMRHGGPEGVYYSELFINFLGYSGEMYLRLWKVTGQQKYYDAALKIAETLADTQRPEGYWYYRIEPDTGNVIWRGSGSNIYNIIFMEAMGRLTGEKRFSKSAKKAMNWYMENVFKTNMFMGFYSDRKEGVVVYNNYSACDTASYLLAHHNEEQEYRDVAESIRKWVFRTAIAKYTFYGNGILGAGSGLTVDDLMIDRNTPTIRYPAMAENSWALHPNVRNNAHLAQMLLAFYGAGEGDIYRKAALSAFRTSEIGTVTTLYNFRITPMKNLPFTAYLPEHATGCNNRLLFATGEVQSIEYGNGEIKYTTPLPSVDTFKMVSKPSRVLWNGKKLRGKRPKADKGPGCTWIRGMATENWDAYKIYENKNGWIYLPEEQVLRIIHPEGEVRIIK